MLAGKLYDPSDAELAALRLKAHKLSRQYNNTDEDEEKLRAEILRQLTPNAKSGLFLQGPVYFDYGVFTSFGRNCCSGARSLANRARSVSNITPA